jgi:hypothetical protein
MRDVFFGVAVCDVNLRSSPRFKALRRRFEMVHLVNSQIERAAAY